jgi:hypothetical protein
MHQGPDIRRRRISLLRPTILLFVTTGEQIHKPSLISGYLGGQRSKPFQVRRNGSETKDLESQHNQDKDAWYVKSNIMSSQLLHDSFATVLIAIAQRLSVFISFSSSVLETSCMSTMCKCKNSRLGILPCYFPMYISTYFNYNKADLHTNAPVANEENQEH